MSHWFDDLTKNLASAGSVPRRSFLQLVAAAAGVKALEGIPSRQAEAGEGSRFRGGRRTPRDAEEQAQCEP
jgi:hypothetical protein